MRVYLLIVALFAHTIVYGWGKRGHDVVCYIAECHLSESAMTKVTELLDGRSMVYYGNWADGAKYTKEYSYTRTWHYFNIEKGDGVATAKRDKRGDLLSACEKLTASISSGELSVEEHSVALKLLIHLIGDMHQPMHIGSSKDNGGNSIPVVYFVKSASLHSLWDYHIVMGAHEWSYTEWQQQIDRLSQEEQAIVTSGSFTDWIESTHDVALQIYRDTPAETRVHYDYLDRYTPIVEQQLLYAGLRLARVLNELYR